MCGVCNPSLNSVLLYSYDSLWVKDSVLALLSSFAEVECTHIYKLQWAMKSSMLL